MAHMLGSILVRGLGRLQVLRSRSCSAHRHRQESTSGLIAGDLRIVGEAWNPLVD